MGFVSGKGEKICHECWSRDWTDWRTFKAQDSASQRSMTAAQAIIVLAFIVAAVGGGSLILTLR